MNKFSVSILLISLLISTAAFSQEASSSPLTLSGYVDAYYSYFTDSAGNGNLQKLAAVSAHSQDVGLNIAAFTAKYATEKVRATVCMHFGDVPKALWPGNNNRNMEEANAGFRLHKTLWLDGGFFLSHIGTEVLYPRDNMASSIAVGTIMEPSYEAGFKLTYAPCAKFSTSLYLLNGYNIYEDNNDKKAFGLYATYLFTDSLNINYSAYVGDDTPKGDSLTHVRIHQNMYLNYQLHKLKIQLGGDYCMQENSDITDTKKSATMYSAMIGLKYYFSKKFAIYGRGEVLNDEQGFMTGRIVDKSGLNTGLNLWAPTLGVEFKPTDNSYLRLEGRQMNMDPDQEIFRWNGSNESSRLEMMINMGVSF